MEIIKPQKSEVETSKDTHANPEDKIGRSDEMREYHAKEFDLPENASWEEILFRKLRSEVSTKAAALGLHQGASHADVQQEEKGQGYDTIRARLPLLGLGYNATPDQIEIALQEHRVKRKSLVQKIAEEIRLNTVPTSEEIAYAFDKIIQGRECKDNPREREDSEGLYLRDIELMHPDEQGRTVEYSYMRVGQYPEGRATDSAIHVAFYDSTGFPEGGHSVAKYLKGRWVFTL